MRDASIAVFVVGLAGIAAAASDAGPVAISSAAALSCAYAAFHWLTTLGSTRGAALGHVVATVAVAAPFAWALELAEPSGFSWPLPALAVAAGVASLAARGGETLRRSLVVVVGVAFLSVPLFDSLAIDGAPDWLRLPTRPLAGVVESSEPTRPIVRTAPESPVDAFRPGALVPRSVADAHGFRTPLVDAPWVGVPAGVPGAIAAGSILVRTLVPGTPGTPGAPATRRRVEGRFVVVAASDLPRDARDLDGTDVVLLLGPLASDPEGARALVSFVRRGGLLAGPALPTSFGVDLERALGAALPIDDGLRGVRTLGAGQVVRVTKAEGLDAVVVAGLAEPSFATVFDRALATSIGLSNSWPAESVRPIAHRLPPRSFWLLAAFALAAIAASRFSSTVGVVASVALSGIAIAALSLLDPTPPDARAEAFALDLGGPGGRRLEVLRIVAGPQGWRTTSPIRSDDGVRVFGFRVERLPTGPALVLSANGIGWIVKDGVGSGETGGLEPLSEVPEWSLSLLRKGRGRASDVRIFGGEPPFRGEIPTGIARPAGVRTVVLLPGRP